jgi:hypothetical protein
MIVQKGAKTSRISQLEVYEDLLTPSSQVESERRPFLLFRARLGFVTKCVSAQGMIRDILSLRR